MEKVPQNKAERSYIPINGPSFQDMIERVHSAAKTSNPKKLCLDCWSVESRTTILYQAHNGHEFQTCNQYSGNTLNETKQKIILLSKIAKVSAYKEDLVL